MKNLLILMCILSSFTLKAQNNGLPKVSEQTAFSIGETISFQSTILQEERKLNIYLPSNYHPDSTYSTIYLLDGSAEEDFIHIAGLVQFMTFPWLKMVPESIVVGIANVDRQRDFTYPTSIEDHKKRAPTTGGSAVFIDFIEKELQPLVKSKFSVNEDKVLIGQSLGGLLAAEILLKKPQLFSHYAIISPSLWWDDQSLLKVEDSFDDLDNGIGVFVAVGKEGEVMESTAKALAEKLKGKKQVRSEFQFFEKLDHANILHLAAYEGLQFLFSESN